MCGYSENMVFKQWDYIISWGAATSERNRIAFKI